MVRLRPRNDPVRVLWSRLRLVALAVLVVLAASGAWNAYHKERESAVLRAQAQARLADLSARKEQLDRDIAMLRSDRGKEAALREQYALAAEGEGMIVIVDPTAPSSTASDSATSTLLQKVKSAFGWW